MDEEKKKETEEKEESKEDTSKEEIKPEPKPEPKEEKPEKKKEEIKFVGFDEEVKQKAKEETEEKKENIIVIKKSTLLIVIVLIVISIGGIIGLNTIGFFNPENWNNWSNRTNNNTTNNNGDSVDISSLYVASDSPVLGDPNATIFVVEFSDYECPYCQAAEGTNYQTMSILRQRDSSWEAPVPKIIEEYVNEGKVKLVFRQFPIHQNAKKAAEAAKCAQEQGMFWEYHITLFEKYDALTDNDLRIYASNLGLDLDQFNECLDSEKYKNSVQRDMDVGKSLGVGGTPTFFIGNEEIGYEKIVGANSFSEFEKIIESKISA